MNIRTNQKTGKKYETDFEPPEVEEVITIKSNLSDTIPQSFRVISEPKRCSLVRLGKRTDSLRDGFYETDNEDIICLVGESHYKVIFI